MFPELSVIDRSSQAEDVGGVNFLNGSDRGGQQADAIVNYQPVQTMPDAPDYQGLVDPKYLQGVQPVRPVQPVNQQQFQSLFPNDPLGAAIAGRGQQ